MALVVRDHFLQKLERWADMKKFAVTFQFNHGHVTVGVLADDEQSAIAAARCKEAGSPVPEFIPATVIEIQHGGARKGSGNRQRKKLVKEPRTVKRQIRWTMTEWEQIALAAAAAGQSVADYQREKILSGNAI